MLVAYDVVTSATSQFTTVGLYKMNTRAIAKPHLCTADIAEKRLTHLTGMQIAALHLQALSSIHIPPRRGGTLIPVGTPSHSSNTRSLLTQTGVQRLVTSYFIL